MSEEPKLDAAKRPSGLRSMADGMIYLAGQTGVETANVWQVADILRAAADEMQSLQKFHNRTHGELVQVQCQLQDAIRERDEARSLAQWFYKRLKQVCLDHPLDGYVDGTLARLEEAVMDDSWLEEAAK